MPRPRTCGCDGDNECPSHRYEILTSPSVASAVRTADGDWLITDSIDELMAEAERLLGPTTPIEFVGDL